MPTPTARTANAVRLEFAKGSLVRSNLSGAAFTGDWLWVVGDEACGLDRLRKLEPVGAESLRFGEVRDFPLGDLIDLPGPAGKEADLEGLDCVDGMLWVVGSHGLKRKNAKAGRSHEENAKRLAKVSLDPNRLLLACLPLEDDAQGQPCLVRQAQDGRRALRLKGDGHGNELTRLLAADPHVGPYMAIPGKDNGLDIEGLAVDGRRLLLGLRGPVLRGHAMVLEFQMGIDRQGHLKPARIDGRRRYRKHLIDTGGAGIRDLALDGDDLLLLTGPTLAGDGSTRILRWKGAVGCTASGLHGGASVTCALDLPYGDAGDTPEGLCRWDATHWLVVHDSPHPERISGRPATYLADLWVLQG